MVAMTRAHIADPHLLRKVAHGHRDRVRSCLACNQGCIGRIEKNLPLSCVVMYHQYVSVPFAGTVICWEIDSVALL